MSGSGRDSSGTAVTPEVIASALPVLRIATRWSLTPARWAQVGTLASAAMAALAADDGSALQQSLDNIGLLGPVRAATASTAVPPPDDVLAELSALIDVLTELENLEDPGLPESDAEAFPVSLSFPVSIYLREEAEHERVEAAVEEVARSAELVIADREAPVFGSWFRLMVAKLSRTAQSPVGRETLVDAAHRAELELVLRPDAEVTALLIANVAPLITSLSDTRDAVVRIGALLVVKLDGALFINQLTSRQQLLLNHAPHLLAAPERILQALGLPETGAVALPADRHDRS